MPAPAPNVEQHQTVLVANGNAGYPEPMMLGESIGRELESMTFQPSRLFAHEETESLLTPSTWPCNRCGQRSCNCSTVRWVITAEAMFLHRSKADNTDELLLSEAGSGQGFRSRDLDLGFHGGPRFTLSRQSLNGGVDVEAIYYSIQEWSASENLAGDLVLKERLPIGISTGAINYESTLQNVELNASKFVTNWTQLLIGFRYLNLEEFSSIYTEGVTDFRQDATVRNDLTGGQIGLRKSLWDNGGFVTIDGSVKSGIYHSNIRRRVNGFAIDDLKKNDVAFVNEIDLALNYEITKAWSATFGYQAMWLTDVGLAADQFHSGAEIANDGTTFFHGLRAGINFSW